MAEEEEIRREVEPSRASPLPEGGQVADHVLAHHHPRLSEHVRARDGALPAAGVARRLSGHHEPLLRSALCRRDVLQNVQFRLSGENKK